MRAPFAIASSPQCDGFPSGCSSQSQCASAIPAPPAYALRLSRSVSAECCPPSNGPHTRQCRTRRFLDSQVTGLGHVFRWSRNGVLFNWQLIILSKSHCGLCPQLIHSSSSSSSSSEATSASAMASSAASAISSSSESANSARIFPASAGRILPTALMAASSKGFGV